MRLRRVAHRHLFPDHRPQGSVLEPRDNPAMNLDEGLGHTIAYFRDHIRMPEQFRVAV